MIEKVEKEYLKRSLRSNSYLMKKYYSHKLDALEELKCFIKDQKDKSKLSEVKNVRSNK